MTPEIEDVDQRERSWDRSRRAVLVVLLGIALCAFLRLLAGAPSDPSPNRPDPRQVQLIPKPPPPAMTARPTR